MHVYTTRLNIDNFEFYIKIAFMFLCSLSNTEKLCFQQSGNRNFKKYLHELILYCLPTISQLTENSTEGIILLYAQVDINRKH